MKPPAVVEPSARETPLTASSLPPTSLLISRAQLLTPELLNGNVWTENVIQPRMFCENNNELSHCYISM
jgi:hypothetical protein